MIGTYSYMFVALLQWLCSNSHSLLLYCSDFASNSHSFACILSGSFRSSLRCLKINNCDGINDAAVRKTVSSFSSNIWEGTTMAEDISLFIHSCHRCSYCMCQLPLLIEHCYLQLTDYWGTWNTLCTSHCFQEKLWSTVLTSYLLHHMLLNYRSLCHYNISTESGILPPIRNNEIDCLYRL